MMQVAGSLGSGDRHSRTVSRECSHQLGNLGLDSLYLVVEYPHVDVFERWAAHVADFMDRRLFDGIPVEEDFVLRRGAHGYRLSVWDGDARLFVTDRVEDKLAGTKAEGQGMGVMLQLGPKWLRQFGEAFAPNALRRNAEAQLIWFGLQNPDQYPIRINRLDIALDVLGLDIVTFVLDDWQRGWVGFSKVGSYYNDRRTGVLSGLDVGSRSSNVSLVVYNKVLEAENKGNLRFWRSVWGLDEDEEAPITRFEWAFRCYQARFPGLRYLSEYTFEGFLGLLNYATLIWGQLRIPEGGDANHKDRWPPHSLWEELRRYIDAYSANYEELVRPEYVLDPDIKPAYLNAIAGWLAGLQARVGVEKHKGEAASMAQVLSYLHDEGHTMDEIAERAAKKWEVFSRLTGGAK